MSDALWAARQGDALMHSSLMADIVGGVLEVAAYAVIGIAVTAAVTSGIGLVAGAAVATAVGGSCVFSAVVGVVVGATMNGKGLGEKLSGLCDSIANALCPPVVQATILTGSGNTFINGKPAARAAGALGSADASATGTPEAEPAEGSFLDMAKGFFSQLWQPTVAPIMHRLERDAIGQLRAKLTDDGRTAYSYDPVGQLTEIGFTGWDGSEQVLSFAYDALGQLVADTSSAGTLQHPYDELGNLIQTQLPDGRWLNRMYYGSGHLHQLNLDGRVISDFERDRLHREVMRTQGQLNTRSEYDRAGRLLGRLRRHTREPLQLPAPAQKRYDYDPSDNLVGRFDQAPGERRQDHLHYDATGRIIALQEGPRLETYAYDAAANLLDGPASGAGLVVHNKQLSYQDKRYRYDGFGRLIEKRKGSQVVQRFAYDAEHRIKEIRTRDGHRETVLSMSYDPLGRRVAKYERDVNGVLLGETRFDWDGLKLLQKHRHGRSSLYVYSSEGSYDPLARVDGVGPEARIRYYHNDLNGLHEQLTEDDGLIVWRANYQVWGNTLEEFREPYYVEEQNLRFQGQYLDRETGLHYNTFRFYDPDVGRFVSPDPIGLLGGINLYQYAPNSVWWIDPLGWASDRFPSWMDTTQGYQRQHLIPWSERNHPFFERSGMNINGASNMMRLPVAKGIDPNPNLGLHPGWTVEHKKYNEQIHARLNDLENQAIAHKWDARRAQQAIQDLQRERRVGFKSGKYTCAS